MSVAVIRDRIGPFAPCPIFPRLASELRTSLMVRFVPEGDNPDRAFRGVVAEFRRSISSYRQFPGTPR